ncbi:heat shock 70 kDa protein 3-like protein [Tanacetum coccineum]
MVPFPLRRRSVDQTSLLGAGSLGKGPVVSKDAWDQGVPTDSHLFARNTPIPAKKEHIYVTTEDNQSSICFNVFQGERTLAKDSNWLGVFFVSVPRDPKGKSQVKVVFEIDMVD